MDCKQIIKDSVESKVEDYMSLVKSMYENPEIGNEEFETMELLSSYLEKAGFETTKGYVVPTGFLGKYETGKPGPKIAFMCEYDALPEVGHGCGHNLIAGIGIAAGEALKAVIDQFGGTVLVVGTPAEENFGGKVSMAEAGVFDDVDAALMVHPGTSSGLGGRSNAINPVKFEFFGKNAHGCHPQDGASALDAAVMTYIQINLLRQFVEKNTFIHGIIRDGGAAANVIPAYTSMEYYFRAPTMKYALEVTDKAIECAKGACLATGTTFKTSIYECPYEDTLINYTLADILNDKYTELGVPDIEPVNEVGDGSTDVGAVSYKCPTIQGRIKIADTCVTGHSKEMAAATISPEGKNGLIKAAEGIALTALELLEKPELLQKVKDEFIAATK
ncbi:M20 family metallopeptidase [Beduini massiliensis]|uniref:M20 family metallopeptidase n=1 Tax=Beduini massiliensis TaxID=1585974 RepID=UPI00059A8D1A|nr:M20 family metallopeptidase [Beduini massiliensis]